MPTKPKRTRPKRPEGLKYDETRVRAAILMLHTHPPFTEFMELIRTMREDAMLYAANHTAVENERESLVALGAFRCFDNIMTTYDSQLQAAQAEMLLEQEREAREQAEVPEG